METQTEILTNRMHQKCFCLQMSRCCCSCFEKCTIRYSLQNRVISNPDNIRQFKLLKHRQRTSLKSAWQVFRDLTHVSLMAGLQKTGIFPLAIVPVLSFGLLTRFWRQWPYTRSVSTYPTCDRNADQSTFVLKYKQWTDPKILSVGVPYLTHRAICVRACIYIYVRACACV